MNEPKKYPGIDDEKTLEAYLYVDATGKPHERQWLLAGDRDGGILVLALDDNGVEFDRVRLKRAGAFIVHELRETTKIPDAFNFLRPLIQVRERAALVGFNVDEWPPVLVNSEYVRKVFDLGYAPGLKRPPLQGRAEFFGIRIVWDEKLDHIVPI